MTGEFVFVLALLLVCIVNSNLWEGRGMVGNGLCMEYHSFFCVFGPLAGVGGGRSFVGFYVWIDCIMILFAWAVSDCFLFLFQIGLRYI